MIPVFARAVSQHLSTAPIWTSFSVRFLAARAAYDMDARERAEAVLRSRIREPKSGPVETTVRQLRIGNMLGQALTSVLAEGLVQDRGLYVNDIPVEIVAVNVSPCLRFATFLWTFPVVGSLDPHKFGSSKSAKGQHMHAASATTPTDHLSPEMKASVGAVSEAFRRNVSQIKQLLVPRIHMKVGWCH